MIEADDRSFSQAKREGSLAPRLLMTVGTEWLVDAHGCRPDALRDLATVRALLELLVVRYELRVVGESAWHKFPGEGGVTGLYLLTESHLAVHTYPEHGIATVNLYCCRWGTRAAPEFPWEATFAAALGATQVDVRTLPRGTRGMTA